MQELDFIGAPSNFLFEFVIKQDPVDNEKWVIYVRVMKYFFNLKLLNFFLKIDQPYLEVDPSSPYASRYKVLQTEVVQMFGISHERATQEMREVFNFERDINEVRLCFRLFINFQGTKNK